MWVIAMFDLPVGTKEQKREYRRFHDALLELGFSMLQYSVYGRPCASAENASSYMARVREKMPGEGQVRLLTLTSLQFSRMEVFIGKAPGKPEKPPEQITLF